MNIFQKYVIRSLKKNKVRTLVTIIGIVLSVAMLTAVTTTVSSMQNFMAKLVADTDGCWHVWFGNIEPDNVEKLKQEEQTEESAVLHNAGYAKIKNNWQSSRPYLYVGACEGEIEKLCSIHITEGRMPKNSSEILLPDDLENSGMKSYKPGETMTLDLGLRYAESEKTPTWQYNSVVFHEDSEKLYEKIEKQQTKTFTVVGFYQSGILNASYMAGYTALTKADDGITTYTGSVYMTVKKPGKAQEIQDEMMQDMEQETEMMAEIHEDYLLYQGFTYNGVIVGLMSILIAIIMFGSIALIYNSFSISVNERKREFGILSSIGATGKQLRKSVIFESVLLSAAGIPLGVLAGIGGMAVTFHALGGVFRRFVAVETTQPITIELWASVTAVVLAVIIGFLTVMISAWIPTQKALKTPALEVIRQSQDIRIRPRKLKTSYLTQKLFGLEGTLASKNYKRNRRKYRATVFSLFISIVLFISASSFCDYMAVSLEEGMEIYSTDLMYREPVSEDAYDLYPQLAKVKGVTKSAYAVVDSEVYIVVKRSQLTQEYQKYWMEPNPADTKGTDGEQGVYSQLAFVEDELYRKYLQENGLDENVYMNSKEPVAVAVGKLTQWSDEGTEIYQAFTEDQMDVVLCQNKKLKDGYFIAGQSHTGEGKLEIEIAKTEEAGEDEESSVQTVSLEEAYYTKPAKIGAVLSETPEGMDILEGNAVILLYPDSARSVVSHTDGEPEFSMMFQSDDPDQSYNRMCKILNEEKRDTARLSNVFAVLEANKGLMLLVQVFSYGFIVLISLIALANVFNTISTNVSLRRREFAMLRSVGMTQKGFYKMMNFECLLYGFKGILYGLPVAFAVTFWIYHVWGEQVTMKFYVPWYSIVIAVGSVFFVVFATMLYSMQKIRKDNVVETLKNENY